MLAATLLLEVARLPGLGPLWVASCLPDGPQEGGPIAAEDEVVFAALIAERDELRAAEAAWQAVSKQARKKKTRR